MKHIEHTPPGIAVPLIDLRLCLGISATSHLHLGP